MTKSKKMKKWQKIAIVILLVFVVLFAGLKVFKRQVLSAALNEDELVAYDAYCKCNRSLKDLGYKLSCTEIFVYDNSTDNNGDKAANLRFANDSDVVKYHLEYGGKDEEWNNYQFNFLRIYVDCLLTDNVPFSYKNEWSTQEYSYKSLNQKADYFFNSVIDNDAAEMTYRANVFKDYDYIESFTYFQTHSDDEGAENLIKIKILYFILH